LRFVGDSGVLESYAYDEFGCDTLGNQGQLQPFGYTGYQYDTIAQTYFAQAREYVPGVGRFAATDTFKGSTDLPTSLNEYSYCFANPTKYVDTDGRFPWLIIPAVIILAVALTGCAETNQVEPEVAVPSTSSPPTVPSISIPPATSPHEFKYNIDDYNSSDYVARTNCYAYAFDVLDNPLTGESFRSKQDENNGLGPYALQPGMLSGLPTDFFSVDLITADAQAMGLNFQPYNENLTGGYAVLLVLKPARDAYGNILRDKYGNPFVEDYHWYRENGDGTWSHKLAWLPAESGIVDPNQNAEDLGYSVTVGFFYITENCLE
jgi:RHS repeat-associated protein